MPRNHNAPELVARRLFRAKRKEVAAEVKGFRKSLGISRVHAAARIGIDIEQAESLERGHCHFVEQYDYYRAELEKLR